MGLRLLPYGAYNSIQDLDEYRQPVNPKTLTEIGALILDHGLDKTIGLGILHRHFLLQPGEVMVHTRRDGFSSECRPYIPDTVEVLSPHSWFLHGDNFEPFEYSQSAQQLVDILPKTFITRLRTIVGDHKLRSLTLVSRENWDEHDGEKVWVETLDENARSMLCHLIASEKIQSHLSIPTGWSFTRVLDGEVKPTVFKRCVLLNSGLHQRKDD
ncbi:hypothetical protein KVT40_006898 [Elsinoe batatas]|uniref:Uncharacterized protein n=1 Tax=Elsinoe batatas TaxID=2601811 RepID=A0A8K0KXH0_9PEZI|nr:hypothetical protein KVT40_006898 [Elsinoe batatas]